MKSTRQCPDRKLLESLIGDGVGESDSDATIAHVNTCDDCLETLAGLTAVPVIDSARRPVSDAPAPEFVERLRRLRVNGASRDDEWAPLLLPAQEDDEVGRLGNYAILGELGRGGMGIVLRARDTTLNRLVALKIMRPSLMHRPGYRGRFLREARAAAAIDHVHVVPIYHVGEENDVPFMAMKLLEGETLLDRLRIEKRLDAPAVRRIARQLAAGLQAAHCQGRIHRDIKPANVWLESPDDQVRILDFGLTCADEDPIRLTEQNAVPGTPAYMSPEQARGEIVDLRSDLFSLGAVLYEAATGQLPFPGRSAMAILSRLSAGPPRPVCDVVPGFDKPTADLIATLLEASPAHRPQSTRDVVSRLTDGETHSQAAELRRVPDGSSSKPVGRRAVLASGGFVLLALLAAVVLRLSTGDGEVVLEFGEGVSEQDIAVRVSGDGELKIMDAGQGWTIEVAAGEYAVSLMRGEDRFELDRETIHVTRNGKERLNVRLKPRTRDSFPERDLAEWAISLGGSVFTDRPPRPKILRIGDLPTGRFRLTDITLSGVTTDQEILARTDLKHLGNLTRLTLGSRRGTVITGRSLRHFLDAGLRRLQSLELSGLSLGDQDFDAMSRHRSLTTLSFTKCNVTDERLRVLARLPEIEHLRLFGTETTAAGLAHFRNHALRSLSLSGERVDDELVVSLPAWNLSLLGIDQTQVTDAAVQSLTRFDSLESLGLNHLPMVSTKGWQALHELPRLRKLHLAGNSSVTDAVVEGLSSRAAMTYLNLRETSITDRTLETLVDAAALIHLDLRGNPPLSESAIAALRNALPKCEVLTDRSE